jgi:hypothetical protein
MADVYVYAFHQALLSKKRGYIWQVEALASSPLLLSTLVRVSVGKGFGSAARKAACSLIFAIATHSGGKGAGAHQVPQKSPTTSK